MNDRARIPSVRTETVELAAAMEATVAFARWRRRLRHLRVVRATRTVHRSFMFATTEWSIELASVDRWSATLGAVSAIEIIDVDDFRAELVAQGWNVSELETSRVRAALRLVLPAELAEVADQLADARCAAGPPREG